MEFRVGQGFDVHRLQEGRRCVLGGVEIPHSRGLLGHSDADALCHAITDALLGAAGLGDIGTHFPDTDLEWKDADSIHLLKRIRAIIHEKHWRVVNVDSTVIAQEPRLSPHIDAMKLRLSEALEIAPDQVGIKATTSEKLGFTGRGEGIAAMAVVLITRDVPNTMP